MHLQKKRQKEMQTGMRGRHGYQGSHAGLGRNHEAGQVWQIMKDYAKGFYDGQAWRTCRDGFISMRVSVDGGLCQECSNNVGLIVHHVIELTPENISNPDIALSYGNLRYVCHECHNKIHNVFQQPSGRKVLFDANGDVIGTT